MTKKLQLMTVCLLLLVPFVVAGEEAAVEAAERACAKAVVENDFDALEKLFDDDLYYSHSNFVEDTKRTFIDNLKTGKARYYALDIQTTKAEIIDEETALASTVAIYETKAPDGSRQKATLKTLHVFRKNNGQWQLRAHQSARKPE
ncbi:MAG: nuclear transport factor 2 family protein [Acidobacteriota bacterium]|nr:MAG: nuclear transport factor 2 family protein [Acidobacteriota bacterium]